jgi:hypothetical protein
VENIFFRAGSCPLVLFSPILISKVARSMEEPTPSKRWPGDGPARRLASSSLRQAWRICVAAADDSSKVLQGGVTRARQRAATRVLLQNNDDGMGTGSSKILQARRRDPGTIERRIYAAAADGSSSLSAWPMVASFLDLQQRPMVTSFLDAWI